MYVSGLCLCLCLLLLCVPPGLPTLPHDPPPMWTETELLSAHIRQDSRQHTTHTHRHVRTTQLGDRGKGGSQETTQETSSSSTTIIIPLQLWKCYFAASSLVLPILRAPLVADAPHVYFQYLAWVHRYNTKVLSSLGSPPLPPSPGSFHCVRAILISSLVPLALHHLLSAGTVYEVPQYLCSLV